MVARRRCSRGSRSESGTFYCRTRRVAIRGRLSLVRYRSSDGTPRELHARADCFALSSPPPPPPRGGFFFSPLFPLRRRVRSTGDPRPGQCRAGDANDTGYVSFLELSRGNLLRVSSMGNADVRRGVASSASASAHMAISRGKTASMGSIETNYDLEACV